MNIKVPSWFQSKQPTFRKTKCTLQFEAVECGAASLRTILTYYGKYVDLSELRQNCGVTRDGSKASKIVKAANGYGLDTVANRLSVEELKHEAKFPCILFWNFNHFLVCEGYDESSFYLSDPAQGRRSVGHDEFADSFTGIYLGFTPNLNFAKGGQDSFPERLFVQIFKPYWRIILFCLTLTLVASIVNLLISLSSAVFIDQVLQKGSTNFASSIVFALLQLALLLTGCLSIRYYLLRRIEVILGRRFSLIFSEHLLKVAYRYYTQRMAGEISNRIASTTTFIHTSVSNVVSYIFSLVQGLSALAAMFLISFPLSIFSFSVLAVNVSVSLYLTQSREDSNKKLALDIGKANGVGLYGIKSIDSLKAGGRENEFFNRWSGYFAKAAQGQQTMGLQITQVSTFSQTTNFALQLAILAIGGYPILQAQLTLGGLIGYTYLLTIFQVAITDLPTSLKSYQNIVGDAGRFLDGLDEPTDKEIVSEIDTKADTYDNIHDNDLSFEKSPYALQFNDVVFGFNKIDPPLFERLNFSVAKGELISVIGSSGSGKSTIAKLITSLYKPLSGEILLDGNLLDSYSSSQAIQLIAYVPQEVFLYSESFRDNISLFNPLINEISIKHALEDACIGDLVEQSVRGLNTVLEDNGSNLSGGQRQRLEIARALSRNPRILILDEATSALDNNTESKIFENIRSRGVTVINVAHRLTSVNSSDKILSIEDGKITSFKSPSELKKDTNSLYSRLLNSSS